MKISYYRNRADKALQKSLTAIHKNCELCGKPVYKSKKCYYHFREYANRKLREYRLNNPNKFKEYEENRRLRQKERICKVCGKKFKKIFNSKTCSHKCTGELWKKNNIRKGKNNPGYRNGVYTNRNPHKQYNTEHLNACRRYRTKFRKEHEYDYCELCGTNQSIRFEVHHLVFASEIPKHKELHNFKNLIFLCIKCHNSLHKEKKLRNEIVKERGLEELFKLKLLR